MGRWVTRKATILFQYREIDRGHIFDNNMYTYKPALPAPPHNIAHWAQIFHVRRFSWFKKFGDFYISKPEPLVRGFTRKISYRIELRANRSDFRSSPEINGSRSLH
jgi:hypothetical protein